MKKRQPIIGIIGGSEATPDQLRDAHAIGQAIAKHNWLLVNGGLGGVMEASAKGAHDAGGTVIGILPTPTANEANDYISIPIVTNMGHARNIIIAHTADILVAIGGSEGTLSEIAIAKKLGKRVLSLHSWTVAGTETVESYQDALAQLTDFTNSNQELYCKPQINT